VLIVPSRAARATTTLIEVPDVWQGSVVGCVGPGRTTTRSAGVLRPLTDRRRDQIWAAGDILDALDDLDARIGVAAR
jgi:hypothetical protein